MTTTKSLTVKITSNALAEEIQKLISDWSTARNYGIDGGVHAWTFCAMVHHISDLVQELTDSYEAQEDFLVKSGYYTVGKHESMEDFPYSRTPDSEIE